MSPSIWTRCGGGSNRRTLTAEPWRVVEAQHVLSTRKLVGSADEQILLEELLDRQKPPLPPDPELRGLHYLLFTPFRYPPLRYGSRFGTRLERSLWYGADELRTAFAETAYYRFVFLQGTRAKLPRLIVELTAFQVSVRTPRGIDLTLAPFAAHRAQLASPSRYDEPQRLGREMREAGVEGFRYFSARDPEGTNVGLFSPRAFARKTPRGLQTWICDIGASSVELSRKNRLAPATYAFSRRQFEVGGKLPSPAV